MPLPCLFPAPETKGGFLCRSVRPTLNGFIFPLLSFSRPAAGDLFHQLPLVVVACLGFALVAARLLQQQVKSKNEGKKNKVQFPSEPFRWRVVHAIYYTMLFRVHSFGFFSPLSLCPFCAGRSERRCSFQFQTIHHATRRFTFNRQSCLLPFIATVLCLIV